MALKPWCANCCEDARSTVVAKKRGRRSSKDAPVQKRIPAIGNNIASRETMLKHRI